MTKWTTIANMRNPQKDIIILGKWDGQPIWREMTPQEKFKRDTGVSIDIFATALLVLGSNYLSRIKKI